ncbi:DUF1963 domain-containing protein [Nocardioides sp. GY 10113]|uniref:DUF1963 domain-containing protein n=1 Tax=Nocardioides sp. GY 10113 TaxID=2569761 RepID=UPI0010A918E8|nr:DUF1963 domain-containing protein [Nocardioides sp. GY 10113]TIC82208.1 DUF1963 domain-containing protein [Nocardioides sp. GY 10113]
MSMEGRSGLPGDGPRPGSPKVALQTAYWHQDEFYADPAIALTPQAMPMRLAVMLTPIDPALPQNELGGFRSWTFFAGAPSRPVGSGLDWPRRSPEAQRGPGVPLTHVLQVDLYGLAVDQGDEVVAEAGLPATGLLQFFHDCSTYGDEAGDADAWSVRWVPREEAPSGTIGWEPTPQPDDMDPEAYDPPVPLAHEVAPSIPNMAGMEVGEPAAGAHYLRLYEWIQAHAYMQNNGRRDEHFTALQRTPWDDGFEPLPAPSRLLGFSAVPPNEDYDRLVRKHLRLEAGDEHVLLADINPLQFDEANVDWLHGGRHLEYWIRRSDLTVRRFDRAWALIRTDH